MRGEAIPQDLVPFETFLREEAVIAGKITPSKMKYHVEGALPSALIVGADSHICDRLDDRDKEEGERLEIVVLEDDDELIWTHGIRDSKDIRDYIIAQAEQGVVDFACFFDYENGRISNGLELNNTPRTYDRNNPNERHTLSPFELAHYLPPEYLGRQVGGKTRNALRTVLAFDGVHSASALKQTVYGQFGVGTAIYIDKDGLRHMAYVGSPRDETDPTLPIKRSIEKKYGPATLFRRTFERQNGVLVPVETVSIDTSVRNYSGLMHSYK